VTADDSSFSSTEIGEGETYSRTFDTAGTFAYHCEIHDYMTGTVSVLAASPSPPATDTGALRTTTPGSIPWLPLLAGALALIVLSGWVALPQR
jgi:Copper binding proteins, plastocyanin/azurin family